MAFTKVVGAGIHTLSNITSHNINSSGIITATKFVGPIEGNITAVDGVFTGNVSIAKTLTYEDVTNVDSIGIITARNGIDCNGDIDVDGHTNLDNVSVAGVSTFTGNIDANGALDVNGTSTLNLIESIGTSGHGAKLGGLSVGYDTLYATIQPLSGHNILHFNYNTGTTVKIGDAQTKSDLQVNGDVYPKALGNRDLGLSNRTWRNVYGTTFIGNGDFVELDVDGHTELDNVNISGVVTATTYKGNGDSMTGIHTVSTSPNVSGQGGMCIGNGGSYRFIQSHGSVELKINPVGNGVWLPTNSYVEGSTRKVANISNNADNRIITGADTNGRLNAEANLTWDGSVLSASGSDAQLRLYDSTASSENSAFRLMAYNGINYIQSGKAFSGGSSADLVFSNMFGGTNLMRLTSDGQLNLGTSNAVNSQTTFKAQIETGTNKLISFGASEGSTYNDYGAALIFSRPQDGASRICGIYQHTNQSLGIGVRDDFTISTGGNAFYYSATERLRIKSGGQVNIGSDTSQSTYLLSLREAGNTRAEIMSTNNTSAGIFLRTFNSGSQVSNATIRTDNSGNLQIYTGTTSDGERLRITSGGDLYAGNADFGGYAIFDNSTTRPRFQFRQHTGTNRGFAMIETRGDGDSMKLYIAKSRSGNGVGILNAGDQLGSIQFTGADGTNQVTGAEIFAYTQSGKTIAADRMPTNLSFRTHDDNTAGKKERMRIFHDGRISMSKNEWAGSDSTFGLTVHTGSTSETGPVPDGIMIVSQQNNGNQNSSTGKLMFCGHAQTNGPFMYGDNTNAYGKKDLVFHTHSTANDYTTQLEETARFNYQGRFGLGTGTAVDSLMHIQGNSDNGDAACQLTIEDEDTTAGSQIPSIQFKGSGSNTCRIRGTDTGGLSFATWNGSSQIERMSIGQDSEGGGALLYSDDRGWATFRHNDGQGIRTHVRQRYAPGNSVTTHTIMRIRRNNWGWGTFKFTIKSLYYYGTNESVWVLNGHGVNGDYYHIHKVNYGGNYNSNDWSAASLSETASSSSPGTSGVWMTDVKINIPNYTYAIIVVEAYSSQYSLDPNNMNDNSYCMM